MPVFGKHIWNTENAQDLEQIALYQLVLGKMWWWTEEILQECTAVWDDSSKLKTKFSR